MAPLTRLRGTDTFACSPSAVKYYSERASAGGLLITEGSPISPETQYQHAAGIYTDEHEESWKRVVDAVHSKGGLMSIQLWHVGRMTHPSWSRHSFLRSFAAQFPGGRSLPSVSPSPTTPPGTTRDVNLINVPHAAARELTKHEIQGRLVQDYVDAAKRAQRAGFDFIEIHAAHGYLFDQFLHDSTNLRSDEFGTKTIEDRLRAISLVLKGVLTVYPAHRVGVRVSPVYPHTFSFQGATSANPQPLYEALVSHLNTYQLGYLLITEPRWNGGKQNGNPFSDPTYSMPLFHTSWLRKLYDGVIIGSSSFTPHTAELALQQQHYDAIAFGRFFISNPDFVARVKNNQSLNVYDVNTFYVPHPAKGYIDYPTYEQAIQEKFPQIAVNEIGNKPDEPLAFAAPATVATTTTPTATTTLPDKVQA